MTFEEQIRIEAERIFDRYFYAHMFLRSEKRMPRKLKKRIKNKGMILTERGLKIA